MKPLILVLLLLWPGVALAEFRLSALVGRWSGSGSYSEGPAVLRVRCLLRFDGNDQKVSLNGRCATGPGTERFVLDLTRGSGGVVTAMEGAGAPPTDSPIEGLRGRPEGNQLVLRGTAGSEAVTMVFRLNADGTLRFATQQKWSGKRAEAVVNLVRR